MTASKRMTALALTLLIAGTAMSACSKEGGYSTPEPQAAAGKQPLTEAVSTNLRVIAWGPVSTSAGVAFNAQPDGNAALWFKVNQSLDGSDAALVMDGVPLRSAISGQLVTAAVPTRFYATSGSHAVHVSVTRSGASVQSTDVNFVVH